MNGKKVLDSFILHPNGFYESIQFTAEMEKEGQLPFFDMLIKHEQKGSLSRMVYRKPTHTGLYLNSWSQHHPAQKREVMITLIDRYNWILDGCQLEEELNHLCKVFLSNSYTQQEIR